MDKGDDLGQGVIVAQLDVIAARDVIGLADGGKDLGLLDGVDAQVGLEVEVEVEHIGRVAGLFADQGQDALGDGVASLPGLWGYLGGRLRRSRGLLLSFLLPELGLWGCIHGRVLCPDLWRARSGLGSCYRAIGRIGRGFNPLRALDSGRRSHRRCDGPGGGSLPVLPRGQGRRAEGRSRVANAQRPGDDLQFGVVVSSDVGQPAIVHLGSVHARSRSRDPPEHGHGDLGTKARAQPQRVLYRVVASTREIQVAEFRIGLKVGADVRDRGHDLSLQGLDGQHVFDAHAHGVAGVALGVGDHHLVGLLAKGAAQGVDLGCGASASSGRVGLVRDKDRIRGDSVAVDAKALLCLAHDPVHDLADVFHVEAGAVEGTVGDLARQHLADAPHAAFTDGALCFQHDRRGTHTDDRAFAAAVEGHGGLVQSFLRRGCAGGEQPRPDPLHQVLSGDVISGDDDHPPAAPGADPVLGDGDGMGRRGTRSVDVGVGTASADVFGELGMPHCQDTKDEPSVKAIVQALQLVLHVCDAPVHLLPQAVVCREDKVAQFVKHIELLVERAIFLEASDLIRHTVQAGEGRGKDHPGLIGQSCREHPLVGQVGALAGGAVAHDQGDARIAQGLDTCRDGQLGRDVQGLDARFRDTKVLAQLEATSSSSQLDRLRGVTDHLKGRP